MRGNCEESEPMALAPESESTHPMGSSVGLQQQQSPPPQSSPARPSMDSSTPTHQQHHQQQQQPEAAACPQTTPAWDNCVVKEEPQDEKNNNDDSGISPGHYTSDSGSPNSTSSASPEPIASTSTASVNVTYDYSLPSGSSGVSTPENMSRDASVSPTDNNMNFENSISQPVLNSQGKMKKLRCKQCGFITFTKVDFWVHARTHMKPEKILECPRCPFATEYKHHLEYHILNHSGSKPYGCSQCPYACVNKSMLNSHLKSHSNVYQFRCADCPYVTKYCHSLKLHLRRHQHKPAVCLNPDGTPNPLPIIDVYGTRRGPKAKPKPKKESARGESQRQRQQEPAREAQPSQPQQVQPQQVQPQQVQPQALQPPQMQPSTQSPPPNLNAMSAINSGLPAAAILPYLAYLNDQILNGYPVSEQYVAAAAAAVAAAAAANSLAASAATDQQQHSYGEQMAAQNFSRQAMMNGGGIMSEQRESPIDYSAASTSTASSVHEAGTSSDDQPVDLTESMPLDLSRRGASQQQPRPVPASTSRRKGRAIRLDRQQLQNDSDEEMSEVAAANAVAAVVQPTTAQPTIEASIHMQIQQMQMQNMHMHLQQIYDQVNRLAQDLVNARK